MERSLNTIINTFLGLLRLVVYANFWVAGAVWALTKFTEYLIEGQGHSLALLNASGTLVVYGFARLFEGPSDTDLSSKISQWRAQMPRISWLSIIAGIAISIIELIHLNSWELLFHYALGGAVAFLYPLPFILKHKGGGLRSIPGLKLLLIAGLWAYITAFIPAVWNGVNGWFPFLERILWTAALTIPFDVRDSSIDSKSIKTLPHLLGARNSIFIAHAFLWLSFATLVLYFGLPLPATFLLFCFFATVIIIAKHRFGDLYYSFFIEGLPWLLLGLVALLPYL